MAQVDTTTNKVTFESNDTMALDALRSQASGLETGDLILFEKGAEIDGSSAMKIPVENFAAYTAKKITQEANAEALALVETFQKAEDERVAAEQERAAAETTRQANEDARTQNEKTRQSNETARANAETARQTAETNRETAEESRIKAEQQREADSATAVTNADNATAAANAAATAASTAASLATHQPVIVDGYWATWDVSSQSYTQTTTSATGHSPYIDTATLTWMVYDDETAAYKDSGVKAAADFEVDTTDMCLYLVD